MSGKASNPIFKSLKYHLRSETDPQMESENRDIYRRYRWSRHKKNALRISCTLETRLVSAQTIFKYKGITQH